MDLSENLERIEKIERLKEILKEGDRLLIAFSGGLDSGFLAKMAADVLGKKAFCVTLDFEAMPRTELFCAQEIGRSLGLNHRIVACRMLEFDEITKNYPNRCAICKRELAKVLKIVAREEGIERIADGINLSDYDDYRPGIKASDEEGMIHPLAEAGITKADIRLMAKEIGLPFWNKPPMACLASRIPYGEEITEEKLRMAEEAEDLLGRKGFQGSRVRIHGKAARIEVPVSDLERILNIRGEVAKEFRKIGFAYVALDLEGYRTGSLNEAI